MTTEAAKKKLSVASVTSGRVEEPISVLLHGVEGIGKTTFGADAPSPLLLDGEKGSGHLDVSRVVPESWDDARDVLQSLLYDEHQY